MRLLVAALVILVIFLAIIWSGQRRLIYFPFGDVPSPRDAGLHDAAVVTFGTEDGLMLTGWFIPSPSPPARSTVMVFNGNAGNRAFRAPLASALRAHNMAVLLFDYRGFGGNPGAPTEEGLARDARAARAWLRTRTGVDQDRVVYFGESLGTAVAARLAADDPPAALILRSPFMSMAHVGQHHYRLLPVRLLLRDRYPTEELIGRIASPLLVIAGDRDSIIPPDHSRRVYEAATARKELLVIRGADHNDEALFTGRAMVDGIVGFLSRHVRPFGGRIGA